MTAIDATDLRYAYPDGTLAVDGVDAAIERGDRVALLGPNGAGKSTLLELLGGLRQRADYQVGVSNLYSGRWVAPHAIRSRWRSSPSPPMATRG